MSIIVKQNDYILHETHLIDTRCICALLCIQNSFSSGCISFPQGFTVAVSRFHKVFHYTGEFILKKTGNFFQKIANLCLTEGPALIFKETHTVLFTIKCTW